MSFIKTLVPALMTVVGIFSSCPAAIQPHSQDKEIGKERPNIVLITADDLGMQLSCYGDKIIQTPNMDRLYEEGVRFTNAYITSASCSPSRSSILTGLYPHQNGQIGLSHVGFRMHEVYPNIPNELKKAGYYTGIIGKIHVEPERGFEFDYRSDYAHWKYNTKEVEKVRDSANEFLAEVGEQPFFLYVNFFDPHNGVIDQVNGIPADPLKPEDMPTGTEPADFNSEGYSPPEARFGPEYTSSYYNQVRRLDVGMGMLYEQLKAAGKLDNTLVIFISDHGITGKTTCRESAVKVPLLVSWPGNTKTTFTCDEMVSSIDLMPTILKAADVDSDAYQGTGRSFLPLLKGETVKDWPKYAFSEMNFHTAWQLHASRTVRSKDYRLIHSYFYSYLHEKQKDITEYELFDFRNDPTGSNNVANKPEYAEVLQELSAVLEQWQEETNDPLLKPGTLEAWINLYEVALAEKKAKAAAKDNEH